MEIIQIENLINGAKILREAEFRRAIDEHNWDAYNSDKVLVMGCGSMIVPSWAYMIVASRLAGKCDGVFFGDPGNPIEIWKP